MNYYNEIDPFCCKWLANLIEAKLIPQGKIDQRSIKDVQPRDLDGFTQCHFFAGIAGWSYALQLAGWPADEPVWTGSCPCQPFSCAGKGEGEKDHRHLWPDFYRLISECSPAIVFGEQVDKAIGYGWLDRVYEDMEGKDYSVGAAILGAHSASAPHKRQRLYWVGVSNGHGRTARSAPTAATRFGSSSISSRRDNSCVGYTDNYHKHWWSGPLQVGRNAIEATITRGGRRFNAQWRIKPGLSLLAYGVPNRVGRICAYGNAIVPQVAAEFIKAYMEAMVKGTT